MQRLCGENPLEVAAAGRFFAGVTGASAERRFAIWTGGGAGSVGCRLRQASATSSIAFVLATSVTLLVVVVVVVVAVVAVVDASLSHDLVAAVAGDAVAVLTVGVVADVAVAVALFSDAVVKLSLLSCACSC